MTVPKTILLTTDFSATARMAIEPAAIFARAFGAKILLVHVGQPVPAAALGYPGVDWPALQEHLWNQARGELARLAAESALQGIEIECVVVLGVPHVEILRLAKEQHVHLIVMATHGRGFVSHALLGSTTERVLRHAPCPVLAVRDPGVRGEER